MYVVLDDSGHVMIFLEDLSSQDPICPLRYPCQKVFHKISTPLLKEALYRVRINREDPLVTAQGSKHEVYAKS